LLQGMPNTLTIDKDLMISLGATVSTMVQLDESFHTSITALNWVKSSNN